MDISYDYYRVFYCVAQCRSFTRAAEALHGNQPNITRCINTLESQLGCTLFKRTNKGVTLTPEGARLYAHVAVACEQIRAGEEELASQRTLESGLISIGASETALHANLLNILEKFHKRYPGIRMRITNGTTPQAIAALKSALVDMAVVTTPFEVHKPLKSVELRRFSEALICGADYDEARAPHTLRDLDDVPMISLGQGTSTREFYSDYFARRGLRLRVDMEAATMDQVLPMIERGLGIGFYPEELCAQAISEGRVKRIVLADEPPARAICLIKDASRTLSIAARELEKMLLLSGGAGAN